jgi:hypothetical protein
MPGVLEELLVELNANASGLREEMNRGGNEVKKFRQITEAQVGGVEKRFAAMGASVKRSIVGLVAALSVREFVQFTKAAIDAGDAIGKAAKTANVSAEALQELRFAFGDLSGVTDKEVDLSLQRFNRRLGLAAEAGGPAVKTFDAIGVSLRTMGGELRGTGSVLDDALQALADIESPATRAAKASELFGDEAGPKLAVALNGGIGALRAARDRARELGLVLSDDLIAGAEEAQDKLTELGQQVKTQFQTIVLENTDNIISWGTAFGDLAKNVADVVDNLDDFFTASADQSITALNQELRQLRELSEKGITGRTGIFRLGGELQFFVSQEEIDREITRIENEIRRRAIITPFAERRRLLSGETAAGTPEPLDSTAQRMPFLPGDENLARRYVDEVATAAEQAGEKWADLQRLLAEGLIDQETVNRHLDQMLSPISVSIERLGEDVIKAKDNMVSQWQELGETVGFTLRSSLANSFLGIEQDWREMLRRMVADWLVQRALIGAGTAIGGPVGAFLVGAAGQVLTRAGGGPVSGGRPYVVGEQGPELFVPNISGRIMNASQTAGAGGGQGVNLYQTNTFHGVDQQTILSGLKRNNQQLKAEISFMIRRGDL